MSVAEKNRYSHRARAGEALAALLESLLKGGGGGGVDDGDGGGGGDRSVDDGR